VRERYDLSAGSPENSPTAVGGDIELVVND
jgi:hypothetical protein